MIRRVLVPLDGSAIAEGILPFAADLHRATGCEVLLYRAEDLTESYSGLTHAATYLEDAARRFTAAEGVRTVLTEVSPGPAHVAIVGASRRLEADVVAMTTHGEHGFVEAVIGGHTATAVIEHVRVPVLTYQAGRPGEAGRPRRPLLQHVLLPHDGTDRSDAALLALGELLSPAPLPKVTLVRAIGPAEDAAGAEAAVAAGPSARAAGLGWPEPPAVALERTDDPATAVVAHADKVGASLVAMPATARSGLTRWLFGSVEDEVLRAARVPVLLLR